MPGKRDGSVVKPDRYETPDALSCWKAIACRYPDKAAQVVEKVISEAIA